MASELKAQVVADPFSLTTLANFALDGINRGAPPHDVAQWLARSWIGSRGAVSTESLLDIKKLGFGVATQFPEVHSILRSMLIDDYPYARDPAIQLTDANVGWSYTNEGRLPKVILVENQFKYGAPGDRSVASCAHINFRRSITRSSVISGTYFFLDEHFVRTGETIWADLIEFIERNGCDFLVVHIAGNYSYIARLLPTEDQVWYLKHLGCEIVLFGSDFMYKAYRQIVMDQLGQMGDYLLAIDIPPFANEELGLSKYFDKPVIGSWPPQDLDIYDEVTIPRDIDLGFCGNLYEERSHSIQYLTDRGIKIHRPNEKLRFREYIEFVKRSNTTLNFPTVDDAPHLIYREQSDSSVNANSAVDSIFGDCVQVKARVFEGMAAGSVVFERENPYSNRYFTDMKDIVFYKNLDDAVEKINFILSNRDLLATIGRNARTAIAEKFDINVFWRHVLRGLGVATEPMLP